VKSSEDGSVLSFDSDNVNSFESRSHLSPRSRHVVSFTLVYSYTGREQYWRGVMRFDRESCSAIIDVKPFSARNGVLLFPGQYSSCKSGTFSQSERLPNGATVSNSSLSWTSSLHHHLVISLAIRLAGAEGGDVRSGTLGSILEVVATDGSHPSPGVAQHVKETKQVHRWPHTYVHLTEVHKDHHQCDGVQRQVLELNVIGLQPREEE
jgi:hypothetical protein